MARPVTRGRIAHGTRLVLLGAALSGLVLTSCSNDGRTMREPTFDQNESIVTTTLAPEDPVAFETAALSPEPDDQLEIVIPWGEGDRIPVQYTCRGSSLSPNISWFGVTSDAVGMAIVMYESDDDRTVHWIAANLDVEKASVESGELDGPDFPVGAVIGLNSPSDAPGPEQGYRAPCPPDGGSAAYTLEVHALGQLVELPSGTPAGDLLSAIDFVSLQRTAVTATARS